MTIEEDLIRDEGVALRPYKDTVGKLTLGVGRNLDDVGITEEEAVYLLANDLKRVEADLDRDFAWWRGRPDGVQRVLQNLCFQLGSSGLSGFKRFLAAVNAGDYQTAIFELKSSQLAQQAPARIERHCNVLSQAGVLLGTDSQAIS